MYRTKLWTAAGLFLAVISRGIGRGSPAESDAGGFCQSLQRKGLERLARPPAGLQPLRRGEALQRATRRQAAGVERRHGSALARGSAKGEIVSDGHGVYLATDKDYGDFEFCVDWLMVSHNGDSGVYLRSYPQVQIWDPDNPSVASHGAPKGSASSGTTTMTTPASGRL